MVYSRIIQATGQGVQQTKRDIYVGPSPNQIKSNQIKSNFITILYPYMIQGIYIISAT